MDELKKPIILMFGIGNNWVQGFSAVYENADGSAGSINVWYDKEEGSLNKVRFITEGESCIIWEIVPKPVFLDKKNTEKVVKEIQIRRDFQLR
jgi:hypothetical protein